MNARDPNLFLLLAAACLVFAGVAFYVRQVTHHFSRKARVRPPHTALITVTQVWFTVLALGCLILLILPLFRRH